MTDGPKLPAPAPARAVLFGLPPAGRRLPGAVRAAVAFGAPALLAVALGHEQQGLMAATGALAVIFGEGQAYRRRLRVVGVAAVSLICVAFAGGLVGHLIHRQLDAGGSHWWQLLLVLLMSAVAVAATFVNSALRLGPPGGFFFVLAAGVGALIAGHGVAPDQIALWTAAGGISALIVGMSAAFTSAPPPEERAVADAVAAVDRYTGLDPASADRTAARFAATMKVRTAWTLLDDAGRIDGDPAGLLDHAQRRFAAALYRDHEGDDESELLFDTGHPAPTPRPALRYRIQRSLSPDSHAAVSAGRLALAALAAGCLTVALDLGRPDWAVLTVTVLLHQGPDRVRGTYRGVHRIGGTALGLVLFAGLYAFEPRAWTLVLILMALQFAIELLVARNYGLAVVFITPLALLMGGGGSYGDVFPVLRDRLLESVIGVAIGLAALWAVDRRAHRRVLVRADERVTEALDRLLGLIARPPGERARLPEVRRELEFELMGSTLAAIDAAHNEPGWTRGHWIRHQRIRRLGHHVLAATWRLAPDSPTDTARLERWSRELSELA
ncbi:FUSC family protein [Nocardia sp. NPDC003345]